MEISQHQKIIVITGVSRGLGQAMVDQFIDLGHTVIGCARSQTAVTEFNQKYGQPHHFTAVDIADESQVKAWANTILSLHSSPDLLINNAGLINHLAPLWEVPSDEFSQVIDLTLPVLEERGFSLQRAVLLNQAGARKSRGQFSMSVWIYDPGSGMPYRTQGSF